MENIKVLPEHEKFHKDLSPLMLKQMAAHLNKVDKPFFLACMMQYYTLIRPGEMSNLKIGDISIKDQSIFVSKEISKNRKDAAVGLNAMIIKLMLDLGTFKYPNSHSDIATTNRYIQSHGVQHETLNFEGYLFIAIMTNK